jgi:hypothetical protein
MDICIVGAFFACKYKSKNQRPTPEAAMAQSASRIQETLSTLTGLCATLAQTTDHEAAAILLSTSTRCHLGGHVGVAYPSLEAAQAMAAVAIQAITSLDGETLGLMILTSTRQRPQSPHLQEELTRSIQLARLHLSHLSA